MERCVDIVGSRWLAHELQFQSTHPSDQLIFIILHHQVKPSREYFLEGGPRISERYSPM